MLLRYVFPRGDSRRVLRANANLREQRWERGGRLQRQASDHRPSSHLRGRLLPLFEGADYRRVSAAGNSAVLLPPGRRAQVRAGVAWRSARRSEERLTDAVHLAQSGLVPSTDENSAGQRSRWRPCRLLVVPVPVTKVTHPVTVKARRKSPARMFVTTEAGAKIALGRLHVQTRGAGVDLGPLYTTGLLL